MHVFYTFISITGKGRQGMEKETKGARTRRYLYSCAIELFREKGYDHVSVDEIVKKAGMAKGTFYIYFQSKAEIITEMLRQYDDYYDQVAASMGKEMSVDQRMKEIVRAACRFTQDVIGLDLIRVLYTKQLQAGKEGKRLLNEDRALFRIISGLIEEGKETGIYRREFDSEALTMLILRGIRSVFFEWCSSGGNVELTEECLWALEVSARGFRLA